MSNSTSNNTWAKSEDKYYPDNNSQMTKVLPPAIYSFQSTPAGWWLEKTAARYTFPYKIYGSNDAIIGRVKAAWRMLPGNLGVLLNGLKGTGKTITAQQIVNWAVDEGLPVLNAHSPVPLSAILEKVEQPMCVMFDEFEKTHDEHLMPGVQQQMLTAIDGLARSQYPRLFLFTTNSRNMNENFIDRPSRIRYLWEFGRVELDVIDMLLNDLLDPELVHLRPSIVSYLNSREILTFDVVKAVILECNAFRESPDEFKSFMHLTEKAPTAFVLEIVGDDGLTQEISGYFRSQSGAWLQSLMSKRGQQDFIESTASLGRTMTISSAVGQFITIVGPTDKVDEWMCNVQVRPEKTWLDKAVGFRGMSSLLNFLWLDKKPSSWNVPSWATKLSKQQELTDEENAEFGDWQDLQSVYGTNDKQLVRVRFTIDREPYKYDSNARH